MSRVVRSTAELSRPIASFSHAVRHEGVSFVGAKASLSPGDGSLVAPGDAGRQAERAMASLEIALRGLDARMSDIVQLRLWVADLRQASAVRALVAREMSSGSPVISVFHSPAFPLAGFLVEVDAVAAGPNLARTALVANDRRMGVVAGSLVVLEDTFAGHGVQLGAESGDGGGTPFDIALDTVRRRLEASGLDQRHLMRLDVRLAHPGHAAGFERAWQAAFVPPRPPRLVVFSSLVDPDAVIQVSAMASTGTVDRVSCADVGLDGGGAQVESAGARSGPLIIAVGGPLCLGAHPPIHPDDAWGTIDTAMLAIKALGGSPDRLLRVTATLPDWHRYREFDAAYAGRLARPYPARSTVQAQLPQPHHAVQIESVAAGGRDGETVVLTSQETSAA